MAEFMASIAAAAPSGWPDVQAWLSAVTLLGLVAGCGGSGSSEVPAAATSDGGPIEDARFEGLDAQPADASADASGALLASVSYPFLLPSPSGGADYFPTVFAHLLGQPLGWTDISTSLACFALKNTTSDTLDVTLRVDLVGYSTPLEQAVRVAAGEATNLCINPTPTLDTLYALQSPIPGQVQATVRLAGAVAPLLDDVHPVTIATGETVFDGRKTSSGTFAPLYRDQAVLSMPKDPQVQALLKPTAQRSAWGTFGPGGYDMHVAGGAPLPRLPVTMGVASGGFQLDAAYFTAGESITFAVDAVACASTCSAPTIGFYVLSQSQLDQFTSVPTEAVSQGVVLAPAAAAGQTLTITAPAAGTYAMVLVDAEADAIARTVTYTRTGTQADTVIDALQSTYEELQSLNITYDNVAFSFFDPAATESVRWPTTVLTDRAANCIDASMLFASVMEALELEPVVVFVSGHAFVGVRQSPGSSIVWPLETTMLGTSPFLSALLQGLAEYQDPALPQVAQMDVKAARLAGILPLPE